MDQCLTHTNTDNKIHYRAVGPCMKQFNSLLDGTIAPELCKDEQKCASDPFDWALNFGNAFRQKELTDIGLARDGHVIKGPYNEDGELWSCDQIDICNGTFLRDGSYVYVATQTFPYIVGCWGPGNNQLMPVSNQCSTNSCGNLYSDLWDVPNWSDRALTHPKGAMAMAATSVISATLLAILF